MSKEIDYINNFYTDINRGLHNFCKDCCFIYHKKYRENNKEKIKQNRHEWEKNNKSKGLCSKCTNKSLNNNCLCEKHWYKKVLLSNLGSTKHWQFLKNLAIKQNCKCIYTDELLVPGKNMSLDHIIPVKQKPELKYDINNVQWITKQMNQIKNELSHEQFIELCNNISKKFITNENSGDRPQTEQNNSK